MHFKLAAAEVFASHAGFSEMDLSFVKHANVTSMTGRFSHVGKYFGSQLQSSVCVA